MLYNPMILVWISWLHWKDSEMGVQVGPHVRDTIHKLVLKLAQGRELEEWYHFYHLPLPLGHNLEEFNNLWWRVYYKPL